MKVFVKKNWENHCWINSIFVRYLYSLYFSKKTIIPIVTTSQYSYVWSTNLGFKWKPSLISIVIFIIIGCHGNKSWLITTEKCSSVNNAFKRNFFFLFIQRQCKFIQKPWVTLEWKKKEKYKTDLSWCQYEKRKTVQIR